MKNSIEKRKKEYKKEIVEKLKKTPIVQVACEKTGIGRATYYRWRKEDKDFAARADEALKDGNALVNDMAESQLMSAIRDKNLTAIIFWLKHHHQTYATRVEVTAKLRQEEKLTPEQEKLIDKALKLTAIIPAVKDTQGNGGEKI